MNTWMKVLFGIVMTIVVLSVAGFVLKLAVGVATFVLKLFVLGGIGYLAYKGIHKLFSGTKTKLNKGE